ncbi:hypothetical protein ACI2VR_06995 [Ralstonia nicotianae]
MDKLLLAAAAAFALVALLISREIGADWGPTAISMFLILVGLGIALVVTWHADVWPFSVRAALIPVCIWPGCKPVLDNLADKETAGFYLPGNESFTSYLGTGWIQLLIWLATLAVFGVLLYRSRFRY